MLPTVFGDSFFDDWMDFPFGRGFAEDMTRACTPAEKALYGKNAKNLMKTDIQEYKDHYEIDVDLPGFKKEEVSATLKEGYITVSAAKGLEKDKKEEETGKYLRRERYMGNMSRSFYVGDLLKQEDITAKFEDGILKLNVPKKDTKEIQQATAIAIE